MSPRTQKLSESQRYRAHRAERKAGIIIHVSADQADQARPESGRKGR